LKVINVPVVIIFLIETGIRLLLLLTFSVMPAGISPNQYQYFTAPMLLGFVHNLK